MWVILILVALSYGWIFLRVLLPLRRLARQAEQIQQGNFQALQQPCGGIAEIDTLRRSMAAMAAHVRRVQAQSLAITSGQEAERTRLAHELHDDTVQTLIAIMQSLDWMKREPERTVTLLKTTREQAVEAVNGLRRIIAALRPPALDELGLMAALRLEAEKRSDMQVNVQVEGVERRIDQEQELALFRATQESLNNAHRHGKAKNVNIHLHYKDQGIYLTIRDDGAGFRVPAQLDLLAMDGHYGLVGIQERVQRFTGSLSITSQSDHGTTLEIFIPSPSYENATVRDPVCSAVILPQQAYGSIDYQGTRYYFCCPVCQGAFKREPETYLSQLQSPG